MKSNKQKDNKKREYKTHPSKVNSRRECGNGSSNDNVHVSGSINDASYYFSNELLKNQLATISFNEFTGLPITLHSTASTTNYVTRIPTAMVFDLNPSAGFTDDESGLGNALNMTSLALYTKLSANNAKTTAYAPQDITTLFLALGSVISLSSHITRIFGLSYLYSQRNRSYPRAMIQNLGVDYDDLVANFANYRIQYNTIMAAASAIAFPSNVTYFKKCAELYSGIYLDMEGSAMAQTYAFAPYSVWEFDEAGSSEGTVLKTVPIHTDDSLTNMGVLLNTLDNLFAALLSSSTLNTIYSDIMRVADKEGMQLYAFTAVPEGYTVLPSYNPEIRKWINNLTVMGVPNDVVDEGFTISNNVYPSVDTNKIVYRPQFSLGVGTTALDRFLNFDYGTYTNDDIIYATRLMSAAVYDNGKSTKVALPDHYVVRAGIYDTTGLVGEITNHTLLAGEKTHILLTNFDWAPIFPIIIWNGEADVFGGIFGDLNYYTTVDYDYLSTLQDATYFGLFEIR